MCAIFLNLLSELSRKEHNILLFTWTHKYLAPCIFKDDFRETNELKWLCTSSWRSKFGGWTVWSLLTQTIQPRPYKRMDVKSKKTANHSVHSSVQTIYNVKFFHDGKPKNCLLGEDHRPGEWFLQNAYTVCAQTPAWFLLFYMCIPESSYCQTQLRRLF